MSARSRAASVRVERLGVDAYRVPTEEPESDGTLEWSATSIVVVEARGGGRTGLGWSYTHAAAARLIRDTLAPLVEGRDVLDLPGSWAAMRHAVRNLGRPGLASSAIAAVDTALWDLKARTLEVPLVGLLGAARAAVPVYGSGGFTSCSAERVARQVEGWMAQGITRVKIKVGRDPGEDVQRVRAARRALGPGPRLFVDANGAYRPKQALAMAQRFAEQEVTWFEEPVSSDDLAGLCMLRDRVPAGMEVAAGEYGYDLPYFLRMLQAGAVDVLQADVTRCAGLTEYLRVGALCEAYSIPLSAHTAPMLHAHAACALPAQCHVEYFHDHVRIERLFFDGVLEPEEGALRPDLGRPGLGLEFRRKDAERYAA